MPLNKLNVYPDSDFWPSSIELQPENPEKTIDLSSLPVYRVGGTAVIRLIDLQSVRGIIPPKVTELIRVA